MDDDEQRAEETPETPRRFTRPMMILTLVVAGLLCIVLVGAAGWYQFAHRAGQPIEVVRTHAIPGSDLNVGEGIYDFIKDRGIEIVDEGFRPSWGAEELGDGVWMVSYVYEVGREAHWVSWKVYERSGKVVPQDDLARELWGG
ncbi:MAG: hypothetical protein KKF41_03005 [Actinobacteria bacterium]|nr:hypothetical protein [Actinomycetota bacterium]MBU1943345.1 hypothetical protein [Actinomycetota bacterium]MBU2686537.1 hypothetical protein [Actinomycetota bacterium]